jgi:hypothetical protein
VSFSLGSSGSSMGPRGAIELFGEGSEEGRHHPRVLLRLLRYLRPHWRRMALAFFLMLVASGLAWQHPTWSR